jgi:hypothetical protein
MKSLRNMIFGILVGCSFWSTSYAVGFAETWRMHPNDLNHFRPDCSIKEQQLVWLASQHPTPWEVFKNDVFGKGLLSYLIQTYQGTYERHRVIHDRQQVAVVKWLMFNLRATCDWSSVKPVQCTQVTDQTNSGSAVGKKCWDGRNHQPYINWWEVVD